MNMILCNNCFICKRVLCKGEFVVCRHCNTDLPRTDTHKIKDNIAEQMFFGKVDIVKAAAFCYYNPGTEFCDAVHRFKYQNDPRLAYNLALLYSREIKPSGWFSSFDAIIPVPIHYIKEVTRGYNQSLWIARGISKETNIPVFDDALIKIKNNRSQTNFNLFERGENTIKTYKLKKSLPQNILIVDDVLTSGATVTSCINTILQKQECNISVLSLAIAK